MRTPLLIAAYIALAIVLVAGNTVPNDPRSPKYHIANETNGVAVYLASVNLGTGLAPYIVDQWVVDESQAWDFTDYEDARRMIDQVGGWAVAVSR